MTLIEAAKRVQAAWRDPQGMPEMCKAMDALDQAISEAEGAEWQGLTDEQIWDAYMKAPVDIECHVSDLHQFARTIEAALKENNT